MGRIQKKQRGQFGSTEKEYTGIPCQMVKV
jgi:hypothetical protein